MCSITTEKAYTQSCTISLGSNKKKKNDLVENVDAQDKIHWAPELLAPLTGNAQKPPKTM